MNKKEIQAKIENLEAELASWKEELNKPEGLEPFDYTSLDGNAFGISGVADIYDKRNGDNPSFRYSKTKKGAEILAKQHRWQVLIQSLRDSLGCGDYEFIPGKANYFVIRNHDHNHNHWSTLQCTGWERVTQFYFPTKDDAQKVEYYLNNHYPDGFK